MPCIITIRSEDFFILADNFGRERAAEVCEDPDTPGDDGGTGPVLDAIGHSTTLALASFDIRIFSTGSQRRHRASADCRQAPKWYDLIAIQEVRDTEVVDRVLAVLAELICRQIAHRASDTALDLHVVDAQGTLRLIIHHSGIDQGEPFTINEEWIDP